MSEAVIAALITGVVAMVSSILTSVSSSKLTSYKIEELRKDFSELKTKVEKHNNLVERMTIVEQSTKSAHHRMDSFERSRGQRED